MGKELNLLTQELLLAGYSEEDYPDYVQIPAGSYGKSLSDNTSGGFEFRRDYVAEQYYQSGCGLYVTERNCISDMWYMNVCWCFENDNVLIHCPYRKKKCRLNNPILSGMESSFCFCSCHMAVKYEYENSVEKLLKEQEQEKEELYEQFKAEHQGKICRNHMYYDPVERKWSLRYDPLRCVGRCYSDYCPVRSRPLAEEKGNVFYDVRVSTVRRDESLFDGEPLVHVIKGKKLLKKRVSMDICRAVAAFDSTREAIFSREWWNGYSMRKLYDPDLKVEIINIRAGCRECRNLEQDLEDTRNGILVVHDSDRTKARKEQKRERKQKRQELLERRIEKNGYESLDKAKRRQAEKQIGKERIKELDENWKTSQKEQQLSLATWIEL